MAGTSFSGVAIARAAARAPGFGGLGDLFDAWCAGAAQRSDAPANFHGLASAVLHELGPSDGLILATTKGDMRHGVCRLESSLDRLTEIHRTRGPAYIVSTACTSGLVAMIEAAMLVCDGEASSVAAIGVDVASDFVRDGFAALKALSPTRCRPFDRHRDGLALGSGAAGCLVTQHSADALAIISGWGISSDATHMTAPDRHAGGLIRAIRMALAHAGLEPAEIDVVFAHGTGTKYNDAMEAVAIAKVFGEAGCRPMVTAAKGLTGHTLGAAGLVESVLAVEILQRQVVPGITGLETPEWPGLDFVTAPRHVALQHVLKIGSGFGGMNAAVVLSRGGQHG